MSRRDLLRVVGTLAALCLTAAATIALAARPASGAFSGTSGSAGNSVATAAAFCAGSGTATVGSNTTVVDTWIDQADPTTNRGGSRDLYVRSLTGGNIRGLVRFVLPTVPAGCSVTSASLTVTLSASTTSRTIGVYRVSPSTPWDEYGATWNTRPAVTAEAPATGSPSGGAGTQQTWTVTDLVRAQYAQGNNGFLLRDQAEDAAVAADNRYRSREDGFPPQLTVSWG